jgi:hypothetical protein
VSDPKEPRPPSVEVSDELDKPAEPAPTEALPYPNPPVEALPYPNPLVESRPHPTSPVPLSPSAAIQAPPVDEPLLPASADLQDAVGAPANRHRDEPDEVEKKWSRRTSVIAGATLIVGIGIVALVFLGRANAARYLLTCSTDHVTPEQGRAFPPWGTRPLAGP